MFLILTDSNQSLILLYSTQRKFVLIQDAQYTLTESENKFETIARKLATVEAEAERSNERAELVETKFIDIEDELKVILIQSVFHDRHKDP